MKFELPELPYAKDALAPHISEETLDYHYGKHHASYVKKLNKLTRGTGYENKSLEDIIRTSDGEIFNNAAQVWNHTFYWNCMGPDGGGPADGAVAAAINDSFGSYDEFSVAFTSAAAGNFGSGWTWLVKKSDGGLTILNTSNAESPVTESGLVPLLTVDVWEHAYYIDYRNARAKYLDAFWALVNWQFVNLNYTSSQ